MKSIMKRRPGAGPLPGPCHPSLITKVKEDIGRKGSPHSVGWILLFMLAAQTILDRKKKLCIILPHMLAAVYIPCQCLSTGELFAIRWEKGREGIKSAKENMFLKARVLYNRMFSSRCLLF